MCANDEEFIGECIDGPGIALCIQTLWESFMLTEIKKSGSAVSDALCLSQTVDPCISFQPLNHSHLFIYRYFREIVYT
jgi:hypothetical protein